MIQTFADNQIYPKKTYTNAFNASRFVIKCICFVSLSRLFLPARVIFYFGIFHIWAINIGICMFYVNTHNHSWTSKRIWVEHSKKLRNTQRKTPNGIFFSLVFVYLLLYHRLWLRLRNTTLYILWMKHMCVFLNEWVFFFPEKL